MLTGEEHKSLCDRLVEEFPQAALLAQFVRWSLDENLETIATGHGNLMTVAFDLVSWADREGKLPNLYEALKSHRQGHRTHASTVESKGTRISLSALPSLRGSTFGRHLERQALSTALASTRTNAVAVVGLGGRGKSQLVGSWLSDLAPGYGDAERVFGWSFYAQGTGPHAAMSSDEFFARAFEFFATEPIHTDAFGQAFALAQAIRAQKTLLILDGVEPFQHPSNGTVRDHALKYLLKEVSAKMNGLCVITTRPPFTDFDGSQGKTTERIDLIGLTAHEGAALLRHYGVRGSDAELQAAVTAYHGHPLSLAVLGSHVRDTFSGSLAQAEILPMELIKEDERFTRLLRSYEERLEENPRRVLRTMAIFDRPASTDELRTVREPCGMSDERSWNRGVGVLVRSELLRRDELAQTFDVHPLVREYFSATFEAEAPGVFRAAHRQLFELLCKKATSEPTTLIQMVPLYRAIPHGCLAQRWDDAFAVLRTRIRQGDEHTSLKKLGAVSADLAAFACFFTPEWEALPELPLAHRHWLQNSAGVLHRAEGNLAEAEKLLVAAIDTANAMACPKHGAEAARNLASTQSAMGKLTAAKDTILQAITFADASGDPHAQIVSRTFYAHLLNRLGNLRESLRAFDDVELLQAAQDPKKKLRFHSTASHAALLVELGRPLEALHCAERAVMHDSNAAPEAPLDIALAERSLARALAATGNRKRAADLFDASIMHLVQSSRLDHLAPGLLDRARFLVDDEPERAERDIAEALDIAVPRGFRLIEGDAYLTRARLEVGRGRGAEAQAALERAQEILRETGYTLRTPMILITSALIHINARELELAKRQLKQARALVNDMGMQGLGPEIARVEALLGGTGGPAL